MRTPLPPPGPTPVRAQATLTRASEVPAMLEAMLTSGLLAAAVVLALALAAADTWGR